MIVRDQIMLWFSRFYIDDTFEFNSIIKHMVKMGQYAVNAFIQLVCNININC